MKKKVSIRIAKQISGPFSEPVQKRVFSNRVSRVTCYQNMPFFGASKPPMCLKAGN